MNSPAGDWWASPQAVAEEIFPVYNLVAARAYEKWVSRGRAPASDLQDWVEAEVELTQAYFLARRRVERRLAAEHAVTHILAESADIRLAAPRILQAICDTLGWEIGAIWLPDHEDQLLHCLEVWRSPGVDAPQFEQLCRETTFKVGVGLPGRVWASRSPAWITDVTNDSNFPRARVAASEGLHAASGYPILCGDVFLGVMEFFVRSVEQPDQHLLEMMASIVAQVGQFLERRRAEKLFLDRQREINLARQIQQSLLPTTTPSLPGLAFAGACHFSQEIGGDYYDFFPLSDASLGFAIGDASGHGIAAALVMAEARATLRALALLDHDPGRILARTNRCLTECLPADQFVTMFLARLDPATRGLTYCGAGHWPGYILDQAGTLRLALNSTTIPLGFDLATEFPNGPAITLCPGDIGFFLTDGVIEASCPDGSIFGIDRALDVVRSHRCHPPDAIVQAVVAAARDYSGRQAHLDDITAVILKVEE